MTAEQTVFYQSLVERKYLMLFRYAQYAVRDPAVAEGLVFDTLHEAFLQIDKLYIHENVDGWLLTTLKNKIGNYRTTANREAQRLISMDAAETLQLSSAGGSYVGDDTHLLLLAVRQLLSAEDYEFLMAHYVEGMQYTALAKRYHATVWACRKRMERIRKRLQEAFPEYRKKK